jgi:hypothetical protein
MQKQEKKQMTADIAMQNLMNLYKMSEIIYMKLFKGACFTAGSSMHLRQQYQQTEEETNKGK